MKNLTLLLFFVFSSLSLAQNYVPELAPHANAHIQQSTVLAGQKKQIVGAAQQVYLAAIDVADRAATSSGKADTLSALARERELVTKGGMGETFPNDLPKSLVSPRKAFFRAIERADADHAQKQKVVDAAYLRTLGALQSKASANPALAQQITEEKTRVLAGISGPLSDVSRGLEGTRWQKIVPSKEGEQAYHFRDGKVNGIWRYVTPDRATIIIHWNERSSAKYALGKDGKTLLSHGKPEFELLTPGAD